MRYEFVYTLMSAAKDALTGDFLKSRAKEFGSSYNKENTYLTLQKSIILFVTGE